MSLVKACPAQPIASANRLRSAQALRTDLIGSPRFSFYSFAITPKGKAYRGASPYHFKNQKASLRKNQKA